jgi:glycosyltransferase involved in cell wall biosynthesis
LRPLYVLMQSPATVICVTPVRNEAWILERFLRSASEWADVIVVADQASEDESRAIARSFPKVRLIANRSPAYDEGARQALLLGEARKVPGRRVIVALDADEALSANVLASSEWERLKRAPGGTVAFFDWVNLQPGLETAWIPSEPIPFALVDDGAEHTGTQVHSRRVPLRDGSPKLRIDEVKVLHFQHVDWRRMQSKQRWYQCWEALNHPEKRPIQIYRQYHRMDAFPASEMHEADRSWLEPGTEFGDGRAREALLHWDHEVLAWLAEHGAQRFRRIAIWDVDWLSLARAWGHQVTPATLGDPRTPFERAVHGWLRRTQPIAGRRRIRAIQRALAPLGW